MNLVTRVARVATGVTNTIRVPHDRFLDEHDQWYSASGGLPADVEGNSQVKYLVDGTEAFPEMQAAIRTATGPDHFIYMLNWFCDVDFDLETGEHREPGAPKPNGTRVGNTLRELLLGASDGGVTIRAMFWKNPVTDQNYGAWRFLNSYEPQNIPGGDGSGSE
jgi:hypothetical protein